MKMEQNRKEEPEIRLSDKRLTIFFTNFGSYERMKDEKNDGEDNEDDDEDSEDDDSTCENWNMYDNATNDTDRDMMNGLFLDIQKLGYYIDDNWRYIEKSDMDIKFKIWVPKKDFAKHVKNILNHEFKDPEGDEIEVFRKKIKKRRKK